jgi:hypothetical protein
MTNSNIKTSPQVYARVGGLAYLIIIITGALGELFVRGTLLVPGNATATSNNILNSTLLWRMGIAGDLIMHICDVILILCFYVLLKPVNKNLAMLAVLFNLVQTSVLVANKLNLFTPVFLLGSSDYQTAFTPDQLHALAYLSIKTHAYGFGVGLIFFGIECLILGYLIIKSDFLPGLLGIFMVVAGLCYIINNFLLVLAPDLSNLLFMIPAFIAEFSLCLWLILKGVNVSKWKEKAAIA